MMEFGGLGNGRLLTSGRASVRLCRMTSRRVDNIHTDTNEHQEEVPGQRITVNI
jgi:hypothetical protein